MDHNPTIHHIKVNGLPYCHAENTGMFKIPYPTNCSHSTAKEAAAGVQACITQRPDYKYEIVEGTCGEDPFWHTEEGRAIVEWEWELQQMRWQ